MLIGFILILAGLSVGLAGLYIALQPVIGMYESALSDPLDSGGDDPEAKQVQSRIFRGVMIGAVGVPFLLLGTVLFVSGRMQARRRKRLGRTA